MAELRPGFRFYPTEEELICFYLRSKLDGSHHLDIERVIPVADVCAVDPWQLPEVYPRACAGGEPWFYFCQRQEREARGGRPSRTTPSGYWKAAGTPGWVYAADGRPIGSKKTMVFYRGRAPGGMKTKYKMNEYRALDDADVAAPPHPGHALQTRSEFSLCRLYTRGCPRQFDRRPSAAMAGGGSENAAAASSCSTAVLVNVEVTGNKRKRSPQNDDDTSSSEGDGGHCRQQLLAHGTTADGLVDDGTDDYWTQLLDSFPTFDAGNSFP